MHLQNGSDLMIYIRASDVCISIPCLSVSLSPTEGLEKIISNSNSCFHFFLDHASVSPAIFLVLFEPIPPKIPAIFRIRPSRAPHPRNLHSTDGKQTSIPTPLPHSGDLLLLLLSHVACRGEGRRHTSAAPGTSLCVRV